MREIPDVTFIELFVKKYLGKKQFSRDDISADFNWISAVFF